MPQERLCRGQVGTVVEVYDDTHFEVEFVDKEGDTYAVAALSADQLRLLRKEPVESPAEQHQGG